MKFATLALMIALPVLASFPARGASEGEFTARTMGDLAELCSADPRDPIGNAALHFCHGFVVGAVRVQLAHQEASPRLRLFCMPAAPPDRNSAIARFVAWARQDPARMAASPEDALMRYLAEVLPCPKPK